MNPSLDSDHLHSLSVAFRCRRSLLRNVIPSYPRKHVRSGGSWLRLVEGLVLASYHRQRVAWLELRLLPQEQEQQE
jgi:hypothetical protein